MFVFYTGLPGPLGAPGDRVSLDNKIALDICCGLYF